MLVRAAVVVLLLFAAPLPVRAEREFPYTANVVAEEAVFRSGPGEEYYGSGKLPRGAAVEVYRVEGGWLGIRPPEGSFSWVAARDIELTGDGLAEVTADAAFAAVGSTLEAARDVRQVQLARGESVALLDAAGEEGRAAPKYYRIAPPSGEFRWIAARDVAEHAEDAPQWKRSTGRGAPRRTAAASEAEDVAPAADDEASDEGEWTGRTAAESPRETAPEMARVEKSQDEEPPRGESVDESVGRDEAARPRGESAADDALWDDLDALDLELSRIVIQQPAAWKLAELREAAELVLERATGADVRSRARRLSKRIKRFQGIQERAVALDGGSTPDLQRVAIRRDMALEREQPSATAAPTAQSGEPTIDNLASAGATDPPEELARKYDGVGTLTRVESSGLGSPQFALVDEAGAVRKYVSAAPGVNLRPFVGRQVGIVGLRGFLPSLKADHVTAKRIEPLRETAVR